MLEYKEMYNTVRAIKVIQNQEYEEHFLTSLSQYESFLKKNKESILAEYVGFKNQQVKPYFDVDAYENDIDVASVKNEINLLFPNKPIYYAKENQENIKIKVLNIRIDFM